MSQNEFLGSRPCLLGWRGVAQLVDQLEIDSRFYEIIDPEFEPR